MLRKLFVLFFLLITQAVFASSALLHFSGTLMLRGSRQILEVATSPIEINKNDILFAKPDFINPIATSTIIMLSDHQVLLFPGATIKYISSDQIQLLTGRLLIETKSKELAPINIVGNRYFCQYLYGSFLIEQTADDGMFLALSDKAALWLKDDARELFDLSNEHELHVPLFGSTVVTDKKSQRWKKPPLGFAVATSRFSLQTGLDQTSEEVEDDSISDADEELDTGLDEETKTETETETESGLDEETETETETDEELRTESQE